MTEWEYLIEQAPGVEGEGDTPEAIIARATRWMNDKGAEGWELVQVDDEGLCIFKRPKQGITRC